MSVQVSKTIMVDDSGLCVNNPGVQPPELELEGIDLSPDGYCLRCGDAVRHCYNSVITKDNVFHLPIPQTLQPLDRIWLDELLSFVYESTKYPRSGYVEFRVKARNNLDLLSQMVRDNNDAFTSIGLDNGASILSKRALGALCREYGEEYGLGLHLQSMAKKRRLTVYDCLSYVLSMETAKGRKHLCNLLNEFTELNHEMTLLHSFTRAGCYKCLQKIISLGVCDVNARDCSGSTALFKCCFHGYFDCIKVLVYNGAEINLFNNVRRTPLIYTKYTPNPHIVAFLLENGADVKLYSTIVDYKCIDGVYYGMNVYDCYKSSYETLCETLNRKALMTPNTPISDYKLPLEDYLKAKRIYNCINMFYDALKKEQ